MTRFAWRCRRHPGRPPGTCSATCSSAAALFAIALTAAVAGAALSITLAGLPVLVAAAAHDPLVRERRAGPAPPACPHPGPATGRSRARHLPENLRTRWRDPATWRDIAYLVGMFVPLLAPGRHRRSPSGWRSSPGSRCPIWYWAPWQSIHGVRYHGYQLGYFPNGPHGHPRLRPLRRLAAEGAARRRGLPRRVPALQLRPRRDRPRPRVRGARPAQRANRPLEGGERDPRQSRAAVRRGGRGSSRALAQKTVIRTNAADCPRPRGSSSRAGTRSRPLRTVERRHRTTPSSTEGVAMRSPRIQYPPRHRLSKCLTRRPTRAAAGNPPGRGSA